MRIKSNTIQNSYNHKSKPNNPSFGRLVVNDKYVTLLLKTYPEDEIRRVANLCKRKINLKNILGYEELSSDKKVLADKYLSILPKEEIEDLTINMIECNPVKKLQNSYGEHTVSLKTSYPISNEDGSLKNYTLNIEHEATNYYRPSSHNCEGYNNYNEIKERLYKETKFTLKRWEFLPVPTDSFFDMIEKKIREAFEEYLYRQDRAKRANAEREIEERQQAKKEELRRLFF